MARTRYRYDKETGEVYQVTAAHEAPARSGAFVISDVMYGGVEGMVHPATGRRYDSKSQFRAETRARGCIEVGNETQVDRVDRSLPPGLRDEISRAYDQSTGRR